MKLEKAHDNYWSGGSGRMVWGLRFPCHSFLFDRKMKEFADRNLQSLGNLIDHAGGDIVFSPFYTPDLFAGISNKKSQVLLGHIPGQSQFAHPVSKGIQEIFVYHILHIQEWRFNKNRKSPCMGYFYVFDYFWSKKKRT
jgi:hypothetical protein